MALTPHLNSMVDFDMTIADDAIYGPFSIIGAEDGVSATGTIGERVKIGSFCHVSRSAIIERDVVIEHYCRIGGGTVIGARSQILYSAQVFGQVRIGRNCIVSGELPNRVILEDNVTYMGRVAHTYNDASIAWDSIEEPSPVVGARSVIGVGALLVGPLKIGPRSYVAAGEVVRHDVPPDTVLYRGAMTPLSEWRGLIKVREP